MNTQLTITNTRANFDAIDRADLQPTTKFKYKRELQKMRDAEARHIT